MVAGEDVGERGEDFLPGDWSVNPVRAVTSIRKASLVIVWNSGVMRKLRHIEIKVSTHKTGIQSEKSELVTNMGEWTNWQ